MRTRFELMYVGMSVLMLKHYSYLSRFERHPAIAAAGYEKPLPPTIAAAARYGLRVEIIHESCNGAEPGFLQLRTKLPRFGLQV